MSYLQLPCFVISRKNGIIHSKDSAKYGEKPDRPVPSKLRHLQTLGKTWRGKMCLDENPILLRTVLMVLSHEVRVSGQF